MAHRCAKRRLACKHRHVVPGIVDRLPAAEGASMFSDYPAVLADDDAIGIGLNLDRPTDRVSCHRVLVVVEAHQTSLGDRSRHGMQSVTPPGIGNEIRSLPLKHLPDRLIRELRMLVGLGVGDTSVGQPRRSTLEVLAPNAARTAREPDRTWFSTCLLRRPTLACTPRGLARTTALWQRRRRVTCPRVPRTRARRGRSRRSAPAQLLQPGQRRFA